MLMKWGTDYVVISEGPCYLQCPEGQTMDYMANCSDSRGVKCVSNCTMLVVYLAL